MIQGEERSFKEFKKFVGVGEFKVVGFNFDRQSITSKCGYDPGTEPVYVKPMMVTVGGKQVQVNTSHVSVFMKEVNTGDNMRLSFLLKETADISAAGNVKYVNTKCKSSYVLSDWFSKFEYREAYITECDFLHFMRSWLSNFKWKEEGPGGAAYPLKETLPLFKGNFNALNDLARRYPQQTVGVLCGIRSTDKGSKQDTCNRAFLPGYVVGGIQGVKVGTDPTTQDYFIRKFLETVEGQYGYKNFYGDNYKYREYDPATNVVAGSSSAIINDVSY